MRSPWLTLHIVNFLLLFCGIRADLVPIFIPGIIADAICKIVDCGHGTCVAASNTFLPFDCECNPGWKKLEFGNLTFPPCLLPNCTLNFDCGGASPPPPPSMFNISDPCSYTICGDGSCVRTNGSGYNCECNEGSANLMNSPVLACIQQCSIGGDCNGFGIGPMSPPPPPPTSSYAPDLKKDGWTKDDRNFAMGQPVLTALLLLAMSIPWI